jgi:CBS domain-containing protein
MKTGQTVVQAKRFGVFSCQKTDTLCAVAERMVAEDISAVVVVDEAGFLAGIITRTDLLRAAVRFDEWESLPVTDYMVSEVVTVPTSAKLTQVAALLLERHIHRVVVVEAEGERMRPLSVISAGDLIYHLVKNAPAEAKGKLIS